MQLYSIAEFTFTEPETSKTETKEFEFIDFGTIEYNTVELDAESNTVTFDIQAESNNLTLETIDYSRVECSFIKNIEVVKKDTEELGTIDYGNKELGTIDYGNVELGTTDSSIVKLGTIDSSSLEFSSTEEFNAAKLDIEECVDLNYLFLENRILQNTVVFPRLEPLSNLSTNTLNRIIEEQRISIKALEDKLLLNVVSTVESEDHNIIPSLRLDEQKYKKKTVIKYVLTSCKNIAFLFIAIRTHAFINKKNQHR
jgi:hypothetical protein